MIKQKTIDRKILRLQKNIKRFRLIEKLTQKDVSAATGIDHGYISKLEKGDRQNPSTRILFLLCHAYDCTLNDLFD